MFYTALGRIASGLSMVYGIVMIAFALSLADIEVLTDVETGEVHSTILAAANVLENGFYFIIAAIVLGVLTDISRSVSKANQIITD